MSAERIIIRSQKTESFANSLESDTVVVAVGDTKLLYSYRSILVAKIAIQKVTTSLLVRHVNRKIDFKKSEN